MSSTTVWRAVSGEAAEEFCKPAFRASRFRCLWKAGRNSGDQRPGTLCAASSFSCWARNNESQGLSEISRHDEA